MGGARVPSRVLRSKFATSSGERTRATYLYCVVRSTNKPNARRAPAGLPGGTRPAVLPAGRSLWLVVSEVPLDRYGSERLETRLRDLEWVAQVAVAHEAVVEHFARLRGTAVVPMKLFTMFSREERAIAEMRERRSYIDAVLKRIAGCEEWGVRVGRAVRAEPVPIVEARSGVAFLAARQRARDRARERSAKAAGAAAAVLEELSTIAKDTRRREDSPAGALPPLLDAAFLVPSGRRTKFRSAAKRAARACADAGAEMTLTGPWPAYNFVQPPEDRA